MTAQPDCLRVSLQLAGTSCYLPPDDDLASLPEVEDGTVEHPGAPNKLDRPEEERGEVGGEACQRAGGGVDAGLHHGDHGVDQHLTQQEGAEHEGDVQERHLPTSPLLLLPPGEAEAGHREVLLSQPPVHQSAVLNELADDHLQQLCGNRQ